MGTNDIRWHQRFANYSKVLSQLEKFIKKGTTLNELEEQGLIKSFEYTDELAWNTMKDFYEAQVKPAYKAAAIPCSWRLKRPHKTWRYLDANAERQAPYLAYIQ